MRVHDRVEQQREATTMAFYVTICLLAALVAVTDDPDAGHVDSLALIWGTTIGLALAHWLAFRLAARLARPGAHWSAEDAEVVGAELAGAAAVAGLATVPVLLFPADVELDVVRHLLAAVLALAGYLIARESGANRLRSVAYGVGILLVASAVAVVKSQLTH